MGLPDLPSLPIERAALAYLQDGLSMLAAAKREGVPYYALRRWLIRHRVPIRPRGKVIPKEQMDRITHLYYKKGKSLTALSAIVGLSRPTIVRALRRQGLMTFTARQARQRARIYRDAKLAPAICALAREGLGIKRIAMELRTSPRRVRRVLTECRTRETALQPHQTSSNPHQGSS